MVFQRLEVPRIIRSAHQEEIRNRGDRTQVQNRHVFRLLLQGGACGGKRVRAAAPVVWLRRGGFEHALPASRRGADWGERGSETGQEPIMR